MNSVTRASHPLDGLHPFVDLERSLSFHEGRVPLALDTMRALLAALPQRPWPRLSVHVAGSEGKTTATELVAAGLRAHGLRVGTFTSPHLKDTRERVRVDGEWIPDRVLEGAVQSVLRAAEDLGPTWFECLTAVARLVFAEAQVDAVVWETGLGGRLDATRLVRAETCVITSVSLEHAAILGHTHEAIAREKAGILRPGVPVVLGAGMPPAALEVVQRRAASLGSPVHLVPGSHDDPLGDGRATARAVLDVLPERGLLPSRTAAVDRALAECVVPGRFQRIGNTLFDGAHTVAAIQRLIGLLDGQDVARVVFGVTTGRDAGAMLAPLARMAEEVVLTRVDRPRGVDPWQLAPQVCTARVVEDPVRALAEARRAAGARRLVLVTGSLHLVGALLPDGPDSA